MVTCCHVTENLFDILRNGKRVVTSELMDVVLQALDTVNAQFTDIKVCAFDAYGTLFDVHAPSVRAAASLDGKGEAISKLWRQKQLEYTWLRSLMGTHTKLGCPRLSPSLLWHHRSEATQ